MEGTKQMGENPGSLQNYAEGLGVPIDKARHQYELRLYQFRLALAAEMGVSLDELHQGPIREVGNFVPNPDDLYPIDAA